MQTGAKTLIRSSNAASVHVCDAPPDAPVQPIRSASTSGKSHRKSNARNEFHVCKPNGLTPYSADSRCKSAGQRWMIWSLSQ